MRHTIYIIVMTTLFGLAASVSTAQPLKAEKHEPSKPAPRKPDPRLEKLKALGEHLGGALEIALDLFSGNKAALLSGNSANLLSGNTPKVLSENQTPIFSGNKISLFSNLKVEIHIENSGNGAQGAPGYKPAAGASYQPPTTIYTPGVFSPPTTLMPTLSPTYRPSASKEDGQPSSRTHTLPSTRTEKP